MGVEIPGLNSFNPDIRCKKRKNLSLYASEESIYSGFIFSNQRNAGYVTWRPVTYVVVAEPGHIWKSALFISELNYEVIIRRMIYVCSTHAVRQVRNLM